MSVSLYFYENGDECNPERIRKDRCEIEKIITKKGKFYFYRGKIVYTLAGAPLCDLDVQSLPQTSGYVLVPTCDIFIPKKYCKAFEKLMTARKRQRASKSMPAVMEPRCPITPKGSSCNKKKESCNPICPPCPPSPGCKPKCQPPQSSCSTPSDQCGSCISIKKEITIGPCHPCPKKCGSCCQSSEEEPQKKSYQEAPRRKPQKKRGDCLEFSDGFDDLSHKPNLIYRCKSKKPPTPTILVKKTGFFAKCCPCCASDEYECKKVVACPVASGCTLNAKLTQTDKKDFINAKKTFSAAVREERKRQNLLPRKKHKPECKRKDICLTLEEDECEDPQEKIKREKAREKYYQKRRRMEANLLKTLSKQYDAPLEKQKSKC